MCGNGVRGYSHTLRLRVNELRQRVCGAAQVYALLVAPKLLCDPILNQTQEVRGLGETGPGVGKRGMRLTHPHTMAYTHRKETKHTSTHRRTQIERDTHAHTYATGCLIHRHTHTNSNSIR